MSSNVSADQGNGYQEDAAPAHEEATPQADESERAYSLLPFATSPRVGDRLVTGHFWGGYDGGARRAVGEAVVDGRISRFLALRVGASSSDLWGRSTAILGARLGILRQGAAPFDLGLGVVYQPQSVRGDGLVTGTVSLANTVGRLSSQASVGYGQDPEGDDGVGFTSLGGVFSVTERVHVGIQSRARVQLWSNDQKFTTLEQTTMDFSAGPLAAYSVGGFDLMAYGGVAGLMLKAPAELSARTRFQLGPMMMLGIGAAL
jgi:hypothetical protein